MELKEALLIVGVFVVVALLPPLIIVMRRRGLFRYHEMLPIEWLQVFSVIFLLAGVFVFGQLYVEQLSARFWYYFAILYGAWIASLFVGLFLKRWKGFAIVSVFAVPMLIAAIVWLCV